MEFIFEQGFDFIDTSESFYKNYFVKDNRLLIPFINLTLMKGHPLNQSSNALLLNYGYLVFKGVVLMKKNDSWVYDDTSFKYGKYRFLDVGGTNLNSGVYEELKILCEKSYLQIDEKALITNEFWIPINTPNFQPNLNSKDVEDFFGLKV